jgi:hypothetical protein
VLLVINPIILCQASRVAVGGVRGAVHVPGAASNQSYFMYQADCVAVGGVHGAVHVPGAATNQSYYLVSGLTCCCGWCTWCCSCSWCC